VETLTLACLLEFIGTKDTSVKPATPSAEAVLKQKYLRKAIDEYEYSPAPEYDKASMSPLAATQGTIDFEYNNADSAVELSVDGAWVNARVWVPKEWVQAN
jgi:hypothetical protein